MREGRAAVAVADGVYIRGRGLELVVDDDVAPGRNLYSGCLEIQAIRVGNASRGKEKM